MMHNVIATGSNGNCVIYQDTIMVDCGVSFKLIEPYINDIQIVLLTHIHGDHQKLSTIKKLAFERPSLRFACGDFVAKELVGIKNVDIVNIVTAVMNQMFLVWIVEKTRYSR